jgi:hypothetical protein
MGLCYNKAALHRFWSHPHGVTECWKKTAYVEFEQAEKCKLLFFPVDLKQAFSIICGLP